MGPIIVSSGKGPTGMMDTVATVSISRQDLKKLEYYSIECIVSEISICLEVSSQNNTPNNPILHALRIIL